VDPLNIQAILALPPPKNLTQLQSLQGKENFLRRFICNYTEITKVFMRLLQKDVPFIWDNTAQRSFNALKHALTHAPLLHPPDYTKDYLLYLAASTSTIAMVLVQEDSNGEETRHLLSEQEFIRARTQILIGLETGYGSCHCCPTFLPLHLITHHHGHCKL
jgi:hypothetical protein